ncbi:uncharacterized protein KD926_003031 [Aspergillus affinis]|uniref:uncharacterized protein n=1 Tax=Aspergillus affinis TaxID=1070780 RepID=UPI0022FED9FA|nr:uncharacterized protein KD926_003031 [Aspergillus affinis]KAI9043681.1 hypothetical protein KD926_003031 [Aspergillus affinis]
MSGQTKPNNACCKITYDVLNSIPRPELLRKKLERLYKEQIQPDLPEFCNILNTASQHTTLRGLVIILDALDESDSGTRDIFHAHLSSFYSRYPNSKVKFLLTTRPIKRITDKFSEKALLNLDEDEKCREFLQRDIAKVTHGQLEKFAQDNDIGDEETFSSLYRILQKYDDPTYLFVDLLFKYLADPPLTGTWIQTFKTLPANVTDAYRVFLDQVKPAKRHLVKLIIQILLAATRPLTVKEMKIAVKLQLEFTKDCEFKEGIDLRSDEVFSSEISQACDFFFTFIGGRPYFIHQTVKDYFLSPEQKPEWLQDITIQKCHQALTEICLRYLSLHLVENAGLWSVEKFTASNWFSQTYYQQWCQQTFAFGQKQMNLGLAIFCCSALPSNVQVRELLSILPADYPGRTGMMSALNESFVESFLWAGDYSQLLFGIELARAVLEKTPEDDPKRSKRLAVLSEGLQQKLLRDQEASTLTSALYYAQEAVEKAPNGHPDRATTLLSYTKTHLLLFESEQNEDYLHNGKEAIYEALELTGRNTMGGVGGLLALSHLINARARDNDSTEDLDEAISAGDEALRVLPENHPYKGKALNLLAVSFSARYHGSEPQEDLEASSKPIDRPWELCHLAPQ